VLFVGRLSTAKNVHVLVDAIQAVTAGGQRVACTIVGEGPERSALEQRATDNGVADCVALAGGMSFDGVLDYYERADVLVLASETEGWPKAIAEAMAFGVVCIGSNRGLVTWMLGDGRGIVVPPGEAAPLAAALTDICLRPAEYDLMRARAAAWAQQHSLDSFKDALGHVLTTRWGPGSATIAPIASASS
jgi:glycosyltransferase involved in cell wall biosynthesis